jgi:hypothetical protein
MTKHLTLTVILFFSILTGLNSQDLAKWNPVMGTNRYIEYIEGNMPLVISIPHGGALIPDIVPERPCERCAKNPDIFTIEIGSAIVKSIYEKTGFYPYVVINHLHRTRLDPNRDIEEAAGGNSFAETAWNEFHNYIDTAISEIEKRFNKGLYIDLHGHRHELKRVELGYLLTGEELRLDDDFLNDKTFSEYSSIRNLINNNLHLYSYSELLKGAESFGTMLEEAGYIAVPSQNHPYPEEGEAHFSGGYNTSRHSSVGGGSVDGIQVEIDLELRMDEDRRIQFAESLSKVLLRYLQTHYFNNLDKYPLITK